MLKDISDLCPEVKLYWKVDILYFLMIFLNIGCSRPMFSGLRTRIDVQWIRVKGGQTEIGVTGIILIHSYSMVEYILAHLEQVLKTDFEHSYFFKWAKCKKNILILFFLWIHIGASNSSFWWGTGLKLSWYYLHVPFYT